MNWLSEITNTRDVNETNLARGKAEAEARESEAEAEAKEIFRGRGPVL